MGDVKTHPRAAGMHTQDIVDKKMQGMLTQRSDFMGLWLIVHCWAIIFGAMVLFYLLPNPLSFILAVFIIGARQLGLGILMHDAAHNALFQTRRLNDWLSDLLCAWPVLSNTGIYRHYHLKHHAFTQQENDPDLVLSDQFPVSPASLTRKIRRDLTGRTAFGQRINQFKMSFGEADMPLMKRLQSGVAKLAPYVLTNLGVFYVCASLFHWSYYLMFWLLPLMTTYMAVLRLRNIAEHAVVPDKDDPLRNTRTTLVNWLERAFIAPYWVNYHIEHHLMMYVPCYHLPKLHSHLIDKGYGPKMEIAKGFREVLQICSTDNSAGNDGGGSGEKPKRTKALVGTSTIGFSKTT